MARKRGPEIKAALKEILDRYEIDVDDEDWVWDCHGTAVLTHRAYEIIAAKESIVFPAPQVVNCAVDHDTFSISLLVTGTLGNRTEWSFGEASDLNYRGNAKMTLYPYAMAEKRGKDRVVAKLVGLAAYCYSEEEADEFKQTTKPVEEAHPKLNGKPNVMETKVAAEEPKESPKESRVQAWASKVTAALANARSPAEVEDLLARCQTGLTQADADDKLVAMDVRAEFAARKLVLQRTGGELNA